MEEKSNNIINDAETLILPDIYEEKSTISFPSELTNTAIDKIKLLCKGNVSKNAEFNIDSEESAIYLIEYKIKISLSTDIATKHETGISKQGTLIRDISEIESYKNNIISDITNNPAAKAEIFKSLKDENDAIIHSLSKKLIIINDCEHCRGEKQIRCQQCHGNTQTQCPSCHGNKLQRCNICGGSGTINNNNQRKSCHQCHGRGQINCNQCHGRGQINCPRCNGMGSMKCSHCNGTGKFSTIYIISIKASKTIKYDGHDIPPALSQYIIDNEDNLLSSTDVKAKEYPIDKLSENQNEITARYFIKIPFNHIKINIDKKTTINGDIIGYNAELYNFNYFLEDLCSKEIKAINIAASNKNKTRYILNKIRTSLIRNIIYETSSLSNNKAYKILSQKYYSGINPDNLKSLIRKSERALRNITQKSRIIGTLAGLIITAILYSSYYIGGGRNIILENIDNKNIANITDFIIIIIGCILVTTTIQLFAKKNLHNILKRFIPKNKLSSISPKLGKSAIFGYLGGIIIYFIIMEIAIQNKYLLPEWYYYLRTMIENIIN